MHIKLSFHVEMVLQLIPQYCFIFKIIYFKMIYFLAHILSSIITIYSTHHDFLRFMVNCKFKFYRTCLVPAGTSFIFFSLLTPLTWEKDNDGFRTAEGGCYLFFIFHLPPDISEFFIVCLAFAKK